MESAYYARYYLGQYFWVKFSDGDEAYDVLMSVSDNGNACYGFDLDIHDFDKDIKDFKLVLKHPSDMLKGENRAYRKLCKKLKSDYETFAWWVDTPLSLVYMIEKGYDAFDLIDKGLALDYKKVKLAVKKYMAKP
jgi:hypothetical protein